MKKLIYFVVALCALFACVSCNKDLQTALGGKTRTVFTVSAGDFATRTIADGLNVNVLHWEIYLTSNAATAQNPLGKGVVIGTDTDRTFTLELDLVTDQKYTIVFWAQVSDVAKRNDGLNDYYDVTDLRKIAINYHADDVDLDDEDRAAFFAAHEFDTENGQVDEDVYLYRPFAQINLGTDNLETDLNNVNGGVVIVTSTEITVTNVAPVFNALEGIGEGRQPLTYKRERTPYYDYKARHLEVDDATYHWLSMNYVAVCGDADNTELDVNVNTTVGTVNHAVSNVPLKENHRTNIIGDLLTTQSNFKIIVDEDFVKPDLKPGDNI